VSRPTRISRVHLSIRGCHPLRPGFPAGSGHNTQKHWPDPRSLATTNGVSLMSFPPGTEMFQFPGFAFIPLFDSRNKYLLLISVGPKTAWPVSKIETAVPARRAQRLQGLCGLAFVSMNAPLRSNRDRRWVSPFGDSRIKACSRLPMTYRSVPRPSSPLSAKASTRYP
jgi:hypothetical protein